MALSYEDSCHIFSILPPSANKIIAAASARVYHAAFGSPENEWSYTGLRGIVVFGCDNQVRVGRRNQSAYGDKCWFRLVDLRKGKVVWLHEIQESIEYEAEKPFFHVFFGKSRKFGLRFDEDDEASVFHKEVARRIVDTPSSFPLSPAAQKSTSYSLPLFKRSKPQQARSQRRPIDSSMISSPLVNSFQHVAHMSVDETLDSSWNVAPEWTMLLQKLERYGIDPDMVEENREFVEGFLAGAEAMRHSVPSSATSSSSTFGSDDGHGNYGLGNIPAKRQRTVHRKPVPEYSRF
ncbi:hypothetical protein EW146_g2186 [Bondarzewia mesenterica]|uniref:WH1 domain-containing protein n=1 Tax=Bondarzewia mesenterica TaxID=1095465 RepID=A0A4S4M1G1_9AGAM|nr:hypothetical protein EW146_g2186 [Bondarzewia mesenterica]